MKASFERLRREMAKAARRTFRVYQQQHPDEEFYAFALYTDDDAGAAVCAANTEQALARATQRYRARGGTAPEPGHLRYIPDEWAYSGAEGNIGAWAKIWEMNRALADDDGIAFRTYKNNALEAMLLALKDLDAEGFFGSSAERERVTLLVWITDSAEAEKWWLRSIKELNPRAVYKRFSAEAPSWCK
jgi:hypothetical protein